VSWAASNALEDCCQSLCGRSGTRVSQVQRLTIRAETGPSLQVRADLEESANTDIRGSDLLPE